MTLRLCCGCIVPLRRRSSGRCVAGESLTRALSVALIIVCSVAGTGKTHVGVQLAKTILANTVPQSPLVQPARQRIGAILVVCFTNHALDAYPEELLDAGIKNIGRVGGR